MKATNIFSKEKHGGIDMKYCIHTVCLTQLFHLQLQEKSIIQLVWNEMSQSPPILTSVLNPFLEAWAILLLFVQQLVYSLSVILVEERN